MFLERVETYILKHRLILLGETVLIGFSGGPDSLCLTHALWRLSGKYGWQLVLAHFDHQLRGVASEADAEFCRIWAESKGLPFYLAALDIRREAEARSESTELTARRCRYAFFRQVQVETGAQRIALGHHQDDQAETVLMRLIRGTGTDGLAGMRPRRQDGVIRPLLAESRATIHAYCEAEGLQPRIDHTNLESLYTRNGLRLEILPLLASRYNPRIAEALCRTASLAAQDSDCLNALAEKQLAEWGVQTEGMLELPLKKLGEAPEAIVRRVVRQGVRQLTGSTENLESEHLERILGLLVSPRTGKHVVFCGLRFAVSYDRLIISPIREADMPEEVEIPFSAGTVAAFGGRITLRPVTAAAWRLSPDGGPDCIVVDRESVCGETLWLRRRRSGDRMMPLGMQTLKKLKDVLIDAKIPRDRRDAVPVLWDGEKIVWVAGVRMDERVRVKDASEILMEIRWEVCCSP